MSIEKWVPKSFDQPKPEEALITRIADLENQIQRHISYENYLLARLKKAESQRRL